MLPLELLAEDSRQSLRGVDLAFLANKSVLITGASGIIGTHFLYGLRHCQQDLGLKLQVQAVVRKEVPEHLLPLQQAGHANFIAGDLTDPDFLHRLPKADLMVHAATYGQPNLFMAEAIGTLKLNTTGTLALLEKLNPGGKFLFLSTSEVYSGLETGPFSEEQIGTSNTTHPRSCYIESKRCGEAICNAFRTGGTQAKSARLSLAYGPGTRRGDQRVLNSFIERALVKKSIDLMDAGAARRTYCYIADAIHQLWQILLHGTAPVYNVGGISHTTIADLANLVGELLQVPVRFPSNNASGLAGAPGDVSLNLNKFFAEFAPLPFTDLRTGVSRTIAWQRALYL
jgi:nucleoside-diphosphate-sugar epimerase